MSLLYNKREGWGIQAQYRISYVSTPQSENKKGNNSMNKLSHNHWRIKLNQDKFNQVNNYNYMQSINLQF